MPLTTLQRFEETLKYLQAAEKNPSLKLSKFFRDAGYDLPVNAKRGDSFYADYHAVSEYVKTYKGKCDILVEKVRTTALATAAAASEKSLHSELNIVDEPVTAGAVTADDNIRQLFSRLISLNNEQFDRLMRLVTTTRKELTALSAAT